MNNERKWKTVDQALHIQWGKLAGDEPISLSARQRDADKSRALPFRTVYIPTDGDFDAFTYPATLIVIGCNSDGMKTGSMDAFIKRHADKTSVTCDWCKTALPPANRSHVYDGLCLDCEGALEGDE